AGFLFLGETRLEKNEVGSPLRLVAGRISRYYRSGCLIRFGASPMAYLAPHFEYDVFVSYSRGDPARMGDSPLMRWTSSLIRAVKQDTQRGDIEFDKLHIWHDEEIDPTAGLTDELRRIVKSSGILMIIMSPRYLTSAWCKDELGWFREQIRDRAND